MSKPTIDENGITRCKLPNGATILVKEDHATPVVSLNFWVEAGSIDEKADERGMAHLIEHMIFKGTKARGVGEISREVEAAGGYLNAFTSFEHTCFYVVLPSDRIQKALEVEFDAYLHSAFDGGELKKEKEVVFEEMRMRQDDPWSWSWELLFKILYRNNPYHWPVIGDLEILKKVPRETLLGYYQTHYVPSNTVLTVVGDIKAVKVIEWIKKHFAAVRKPPAPARRFTMDREPESLRLLTEAGDLQQIYLSLGFPTVPMNHPDSPVLEILEAVLGDGSACRLNLAIREKSQSADEAGSDHFSGKYGGAFVFQGLTDGRRVEKCLLDIMREVKKIILYGVPDDELGKVKNKIKASKIFEKQNMDGQAKTLGFWELNGGYRLEEKFLKALDAVTSQDLRRAAGRYLKPRRASLVLYHPQRQKLNQKPAYWQALLKKGLESVESLKTPGPARQPLKKYKLKNGSTLLVKRREGLPLASLGVFLKGGFAREQANPGTTALMTKCLVKGTAKRNYKNYSEEVEALAAHIDPLMEKDYWGVTLDCIKPQFEKSFHLMSETLFQPLFSESEVEKEKKLQIAAIERLKDDPSEYAMLQSDVLTFAGTPYSHMPMGTPESLGNIHAADIRKWHQAHLTAGNMTWVAVGDFEGSELRDFLDSNLPQKFPPSAPNRKIRKPRPLRSNSLFLESNSRQANLVLGFRAPRFASKEYFIFRVLNTILNGMGGRLFVELREKKSLAYSVYAAHDAGLLEGAYQLYIGCAPAKVEDAKRELLKVLGDLSRDGISSEELERAKTYMIGLYQVGLQSNRSQVLSFGRYALSGLGADTVERIPRIIRAIRGSEVQGAVKKYLQTADKTWVLLAPRGETKGKK